MDNKQKEREAARVQFHQRRELETNEHDFAFLDGYDAGQSARPEPPEPDGDLVAAARERIFTACEVNAHDQCSHHFTFKGESFTCGCGCHTTGVGQRCQTCQHGLEAHRPEGSCNKCECGQGDGLHHPNCTQFTPAPAGPERRIAAGDGLEMVEANAEAYERKRIAAELREIVDASKQGLDLVSRLDIYIATNLDPYTDKLEGAKDVD
jgi:hypothetical protein